LTASALSALITNTMATRKSPRKVLAEAPDTTGLAPTVVNLDRYVPAILTWIANKLSSGASKHYLNVFDVGIETWRCLVLLAVEGAVSAQRVSKVIGMDKASVSRCFKSMQAKGFIGLELDPADGRARIATLTVQGKKLHDQILGLALAREQALLSVLDAQEQEVLIGLLRRLHENLPAVETAAQRYVETNFPAHKILND
jgi:DNA-binding MarR family transcriptional regulator